MWKKKVQVTRRVSAKKKVLPSLFLFDRHLSIIDQRLILFFSLIIMPLLIVLGVRYWIKQPESLMIKSVKVQGDFNFLDKATLSPIISPFVKTNLYLLDKKSLEEEIEFNPWVYSASLTSLWPTTLVVKIHEQKPIAFWGDKAMVNEFGEVIDVDLPAQKNKLPMLYSPFDKGREMVESYVKIRKWMKDFPVDIVEFTENTRGSWLLKLSNGMKVKVGRKEHERRLRRFMVGYSNQLVRQVKKIDTVDLRYTNGFAVKWL
jgi:cell division protein FtsQ